MIFASQDPESKAFVVFLTVVVAIINIGMLIWLVVGMIFASLFYFLVLE